MLPHLCNDIRPSETASAMGAIARNNVNLIRKVKVPMTLNLRQLFQPIAISFPV